MAVQRPECFVRREISALSLTFVHMLVLHDKRDGKKFCRSLPHFKFPLHDYHMISDNNFRVCDFMARHKRNAQRFLSSQRYEHSISRRRKMQEDAKNDLGQRSLQWYRFRCALILFLYLSIRKKWKCWMSSSMGDDWRLRNGVGMEQRVSGNHREPI